MLPRSTTLKSCSLPPLRRPTKNSGSGAGRAGAGANYRAAGADGRVYPQVRAACAARLEAQPTGLVAFLGWVTGVLQIIAKLHQYRNAKAFRAFVAEGQQSMWGRSRPRVRLSGCRRCRRWRSGAVRKVVLRFRIM